MCTSRCNNVQLHSEWFINASIKLTFAPWNIKCPRDSYRVPITINIYIYVQTAPRNALCLEMKLHFPKVDKLLRYNLSRPLNFAPTFILYLQKKKQKSVHFDIRTRVDTRKDNNKNRTKRKPGYENVNRWDALIFLLFLFDRHDQKSDLVYNTCFRSNKHVFLVYFVCLLA